MKQLRIRYQALEAWLHRLSVRERGIILGALAIVLLGLFDQLLLRPLLHERQSIAAAKDNVMLQIEQANLQIDELQQAISRNPNEVMRKSIRQLLVMHDNLDEEINELTDGMIAPENMALLLGEMLSEKYGMKVQSVQSSPAERLLVADEQAADGPAIYRHALELNMTGTFFQVRDYLAAVESLPQKLLWDQLEYVVEDYPRGKLHLQVHTLSTQEVLLRVAN